MNIFRGLLMEAGIGNPDAARALSECEIAQMQAAQAIMARPYTPSPYDLMALSNYRPPVHVPAGWADWSAHAGEMV